MIKCIKCNIKKEDNEFYKGKNSCKKCVIKRQIKKNKTKDGFIAQLYRNQKSNSISRNRPIPTYTKEELKEWLYSQKEFHTLFDNWKRLDFQTEYAPSVDRLDDYVGYTLSNIQLMTWNENNKKANESRKNGTNNKSSKAVEQYKLNGKLIATYHSQKEAERQTGITQTQISVCCLDKQKTAGGYIWKFRSAV